MKTGHFKRLIPVLLALVFSVFVSDFALAQAPVSICVLKDRNQGGATVQDCINVDSTNPLPVSSSSGTGASQIQGNTATGTTDIGNPVAIGGQANTTSGLTTATSGQRQEVWVGGRGNTIIGAVSAVATNGTSNTINLIPDQSAGTSRPLGAALYGQNGSTWDLVRTDPTTLGALWSVPVGRASIATSQVSVTTGNVSVCPARASRNSCTITNITGTSDIYCGATGVTTSTGTLLLTTKGAQLTIPTVAAVFCTVATTSQTVSILETF